MREETTFFGWACCVFFSSRRRVSDADGTFISPSPRPEFVEHSDLFLQGSPARIILVVGGELDFFSSRVFMFVISCHPA